MLWKPCGTVYYRGETATYLKSKLLALQTELVKDVLVKIASVQHLREQDYRSTAFQFSEMSTTIQRLHNKIVERFMEVAEDNSSFSIEEKVNKVSDAHRYYMEIDGLTRLIQMWEKNQIERLKQKMGPGLRTRGEQGFKSLLALEAGEAQREDERFESSRTSVPPRSTRTWPNGRRKNKLWHAGNKDY
ncbi:uncharacterized protein LOC142986433 isoform X3 [Anticarsia gemmatalis]|uniref:uncharacterized protein LOC142986433 isoform X2 n=1 Tax=Anticarsia gemmatalis TaxID=129554 RepID=UPI003F77213C